MGINTIPIKKIEFKNKYVYITLKNGNIIKHLITKAEFTLDLLAEKKPEPLFLK